MTGEGDDRPGKGSRTRAAVLRAVVDLASLEGLEGASIGRIAESVGMSKSGLYAHFGSKSDLQLEAVRTAERILQDDVIRPALTHEPGLPRLWALLRESLLHVDRRVFSGGCFFTAAMTDQDSRPGPVRDRLADNHRRWCRLVHELLVGAREEGHIDARADIADLALQLEAIRAASVLWFLLHGDHDIVGRGLASIRRRLEAVATTRAPALPD